MEHTLKGENMSISAVSASSMSQMGGSNPMAQMKQYFDNLGTALQSGNLDDAKKAFSELQKKAPSQGGDGKNPMSDEIAKLQKALDSGDLKGAQEAYSNIKKIMSQGPAGGAAAGGRPPQDPQKDSVELSSSKSGDTSSTSSSKVYDKMDTNKDGTVSAMEVLAYELENPSDSTSVSVLTVDKNKENSSKQTYA
jgi:soluble cytochrome b562